MSLGIPDGSSGHAHFETEIKVMHSHPRSGSSTSAPSLTMAGIGT
jgi:hypothetical protein